MRKTKFLLFALAFMMFGVMNAEIASGTFGKDGDNITWVLDDDGTLTLSGSGEMEDYISSSNVPWDSNRKQIIKVSISEGITNIGEEAFSGCSGLTSVTIPNSVTSIGSSAFYGCDRLPDEDGICYVGNWVVWRKDNLVSANIKEGTIGIVGYAFAICSGLTSVTIPNSVTSIGALAFSGCSGLTSVTIPNSVTSIGAFAFAYCSGLTSVDIADIAAWCNINFATKDSNPLTYGHKLLLNGEEINELVIPNSVTSIGRYAFYNCRCLTSVTIPNSVTNIGWSAFKGCTNMREIPSNNITYPSVSSDTFSGIKTEN